MVDRKINETKNLEEIRIQTRLKNMYFNRYLMIRYFLAIFIFTNFYWFISTSNFAKFIPVILLVLGFLCCFEAIKVYGNPYYVGKWTKLYFQLQAIVNMSCLILMWSPIFNFLFPFLNSELLSYIILIVMCFVGLFMAIACIRRLNEINKNEDKNFKFIKQYELAAKEKLL
ncbi:MAG: hypothetical protein ACK5G7_05205 [Erysipelotrichaceae bacterium]